jgi:hypothetical protein
METTTLGSTRRKVMQKPETDRITTTVEEQTKALPNIGFLVMALGGICVSAALSFFYKKRELGNFVGLWVPTFLIFGLYNKLVQFEDEILPSHGIH